MSKRDSDATDIDQKHFIIDALAAIPRWVVGLIGTLLGVGITLAFFLQVTGLAGPAHRIIDAWASRFETAAKEVNRSVSRLDTIVSRIETLEDSARKHAADTAVLEQRVTKLERESADQGEELARIRAATSVAPAPVRQRAPRPVTTTGTAATAPPAPKGIFPW